jgi:hypothetical protein
MAQPARNPRCLFCLFAGSPKTRDASFALPIVALAPSSLSAAYMRARHSMMLVIDIDDDCKSTLFPTLSSRFSLLIYHRL